MVVWNPNVMVESGYRLGLDLPIVFIREHVSQNEPLLPFDLFNLQVVELPTDDEEEKKRIVRKQSGKSRHSWQPMRGLRKRRR